MTCWSACALLLAAASGAGQASLDTHYLSEVQLIAIRIDRYSGDPNSVGGIPEALQRLIDANPTQARAYVIAAQYLVFVGSQTGWPGRGKDSTQAADSLLDDALKVDPRNCEAYWIRGQLRLANQQADSALATVAAARGLGCEDLRLNVVSGRALLSKRDTDAEPELRKVFEAGPGITSRSRATYSAAAYDYGSYLYQTGRHAELRKVLGDWEAAGLVYHAWNQINMAHLFTLIGEFDHAVVAAKGALVFGNIVNARNILGVALYGKAWKAEADGLDAGRLLAAAREYLPDETLALNVLTGAGCCVADSMKAVMSQRAKRLVPAQTTAH